MGDLLLALQAYIEKTLITPGGIKTVKIMSDNEVLLPGSLNYADFPTCLLFEVRDPFELGTVSGFLRHSFVVEFVVVNSASSIHEARFNEKYGIYSLQNTLLLLLLRNKLLDGYLENGAITGLLPNIEPSPVEIIDSKETELYMTGKRMEVTYYDDFYPWNTSTLNEQ